MREDNDCVQNFGGEINLETTFLKTDKRFDDVIKKTFTEMGYEDERWICVYGSCNLAGSDVSSAEHKILYYTLIILSYSTYTRIWFRQILTLPNHYLAFS
jgi:hypothetical protein